MEKEKIMASPADSYDDLRRRVAQFADAVTVFVREPVVRMHNCIVFIMHP